MEPVKLVYFSWIRERVGMSDETINLPADVTTIDALFGWLRSRGEEFEAFLEQPDVVRVALDQEHVGDRNTSIAGVREIALFPQMTGG